MNFYSFDPPKANSKFYNFLCEYIALEIEQVDLHLSFEISMLNHV